MSTAKTKTYKTLRALIKAKYAGKLPPDFLLMIDNDSIDACSDGRVVQFSMDPHDLLVEALEILGFKAESV